MNKRKEDWELHLKPRESEYVMTRVHVYNHGNYVSSFDIERVDEDYLDELYKHYSELSFKDTHDNPISDIYRVVREGSRIKK